MLVRTHHRHRFAFQRFDALVALHDAEQGREEQIRDAARAAGPEQVDGLFQVAALDEVRDAVLLQDCFQFIQFAEHGYSRDGSLFAAGAIEDRDGLKGVEFCLEQHEQMLRLARDADDQSGEGRRIAAKRPALHRIEQYVPCADGDGAECESIQQQQAAEDAVLQKEIGECHECRAHHARVGDVGEIACGLLRAREAEGARGHKDQEPQRRDAADDPQIVPERQIA